MGSLEMLSSSSTKEKIIQRTPSFPIKEILDNRNKTNSNKKFLEIITKIIVKDIPSIDDKYLNIMILDDKRLLVGYTLYLIIISAKTFKKELIIDLRDIITEYNNFTSIIYLIQIKNCILSVVINRSNVYFIKLSKSSYKLVGKLVSKNPKKVIEKNNYLYILEKQEISVWQDEFNKFSYSYIKYIPLNGIRGANFIFINDQEIAITGFQRIMFYNLESNNKFQIRCEESSLSPEFCPNNMILLNNKILLMGCIDSWWGFGSVFLIDTIKKEIICHKVLQLYSIIKIKMVNFYVELWK